MPIMGCPVGSVGSAALALPASGGFAAASSALATFEAGAASTSSLGRFLSLPDSTLASADHGETQETSTSLSTEASTTLPGSPPGSGGVSELWSPRFLFPFLSAAASSHAPCGLSPALLAFGMLKKQSRSEYEGCRSQHTVGRDTGCWFQLMARKSQYICYAFFTPWNERMDLVSAIVDIVLNSTGDGHCQDSTRCRDGIRTEGRTFSTGG